MFLFFLLVQYDTMDITPPQTEEVHAPVPVKVVEQEKKKGIYYYLSRIVQEFMEAFIAYTIFSLVMYKTGEKLEVLHVMYVACIIGSVTFLIEEYDPKYRESIKAGIMVTIGTAMLKTL